MYHNSKRTTYFYVLMKNISLILLPFVTVSIECFIKYISWPNSKTSELWLLSQQRAKFINTKFWTSIQASGRIAYSVDHDNSSVGQWLCTLYIVESSMATSVNRSLLLLSVQCIRDCRFIVLSFLQLTIVCYNFKGRTVESDFWLGENIDGAIIHKNLFLNLKLIFKGFDMHFFCRFLHIFYEFSIFHC